MNACSPRLSGMSRLLIRVSCFSTCLSNWFMYLWRRLLGSMRTRLGVSLRIRSCMGWVLVGLSLLVVVLLGLVVWVGTDLNWR